MRETKIRNYLITEVAKLGGEAENFATPGRKGPPDLITTWPGFCPCCPRPTVEFIETKTKGGVLKPWQERDHERRRAKGFNVWVIWNMEQAEEYLATRGKI